MKRFSLYTLSNFINPALDSGTSWYFGNLARKIACFQRQLIYDTYEDITQLNRLNPAALSPGTAQRRSSIENPSWGCLIAVWGNPCVWRKPETRGGLCILYSPRRLNLMQQHSSQYDFPTTLASLKANGIDIPHRFAVIRTDTNEPLGIISDQYQLIPHKEVLEKSREALIQKKLKFEEKTNITH